MKMRQKTQEEEKPQKPSLEISMRDLKHTACTQVVCILMTLQGGGQKTSQVLGCSDHHERILMQLWARKTVQS